MQQLNHQTGKALECTRDANRRRDLDQDTLGGMNVDLKLAGLVDGGVEQGQEALVSMVSMLDADTAG